MRARLAFLLVALPLPAVAHSGLIVGFDAPRGVADVVIAGDPYEVRWHDGDLGSFELQLRARPTPPAPYIHAWPISEIQDPGSKLGAPIQVRDTQNTFAVDTRALGPGTWFFWFSVSDERGVTEYQPPEGMLAIVAPGEEPDPAVWFDLPDGPRFAREDTFEIAYSTRPASGVTVQLLSSVNDLEGEHLVPIADGLPGGDHQPFTLPLRCVRGAAGIAGVVRDESGRTGTAMAIARVSHRPPAGEDLPADCPREEPEAVAPDPPQHGGCCAATGGPVSALPFALLLYLLRAGSTVRSSPRSGGASSG